ncbi:MAG: hypothetical protein JO295_02795 [Verrucomicrobia bacterium]|nr:hypothetical protein [Verrucomicrobiota bacterium]
MPALPTARPLARSVADVLEKPRWSRGRRIFWSLVLLALLGAGLWLPLGGWKTYRRWQAQRLCRQARALFAAGDSRTAALAVRRALALDHAAVDAYRIIAEQTADAGAPAAVTWWRQVVQLQPAPGAAVADRFALAGAALRFGNLALAQETLDGMDAGAKTTAAWHSAYGKWLAARWQLADAAAHFATARELAPGNLAYAFDDTSIRLLSTDPATRTAARDALQKFAAAHPAWQPAARRALLLDSVSRQDWPAALADGRGLTEDGPFSDRLAYLDVLRHADPGAFPILLGRLQAQAEHDHPAQVAALIAWFAGHDLPERGAAWASALNREILADPGVSQSLATCHVATRDWTGLQTLLRAAAQWGPREFLRHALLARACVEKHLDDSARAEWTLAADQAVAAGSARELAALAADWGWPEKRSALLWVAAEHGKASDAAAFNPTGAGGNDADWALGQLYADATAAGDTRAAYRAAGRLLALHPADPAVRNIHTLLALLLNEDLPRAAAAAAALHAQDPARADWATTAALALYLTSRPADALRTLTDLAPATLREPGRAAYFGLLLAVNAEKTRAAEFLDLAAAAPLLPEEKALISEGRARLR